MFAFRNAQTITTEGVSTYRGQNGKLMLVAEASDFGPTFDLVPEIDVVSTRTGRVMTMARCRIEMKDGDLLYCDYQPADPNVPVNEPFIFRIFND